MSDMIQEQRVHIRNRQPLRLGREYIVYWMQQSQREHYNHALEYAIDCANELKKPLIVLFGLTDSFPDANLRHYYFMLEGLRDTQAGLAIRGILMVIKKKSPELAAVQFSKRACMVVTDCGYEKIQRTWRNYVYSHTDCQCAEVEADTIVPVGFAADKEQYTAGVFRPRVTAHFVDFITPLEPRKVEIKSLGMKFDSLDISDIEKTLRKLKLDTSVRPSPLYHGSTTTALQLLDDFIEKHLEEFADCRNDPGKECLSNMSPYLHFGQISPVYLAIRITAADKAGTTAYLEELGVRRELSWNFVRYNSNYDNFNCLPNWARNTLSLHARDKRPRVYTLEELETAQTYDPYWNAAQMEMVLTGKMHGYMRMYWGKKILEWTKRPEEAYRRALYLNNKYFIDGRDPNGYAGVAWCFGKHDRPWQQRSIFGKVRYMNAEGLKRKRHIDDYVRRIELLKNELR
jgi:deoxyribodipyrimidine photo-lyase